MHPDLKRCPSCNRVQPLFMLEGSGCMVCNEQRKPTNNATEEVATAMTQTAKNRVAGKRATKAEIAIDVADGIVHELGLSATQIDVTGNVVTFTFNGTTYEVVVRIPRQR
jgi:hypothetical protein